MDQYFFKVTADYWQTQNLLQAEAKTAIRQLDHMLVSENNIDEFISGIYDRITDLNYLHSRCKPLKIEKILTFPKSLGEETYLIPGVTQLTKYMVKNPLGK